MVIIKAENLACPIDGARLVAREKQLVCEIGHAFDVARQGYIHLLPVQHKRSKHPGDSKDMVAARAQFLNSGFYAPIAKHLADTVRMHIAGNKPNCVLDAGCGEGYYLDYLCGFFSENKGQGEISFIGLDISKAAIAEAAKRNKRITWIVGTNRQPPVRDASVDIILCLFGFHSFVGFNKILKPGGTIILVEPGPDHLKELREIIYPEVKKSDLSDLSYLEESGLSMRDRRPLLFKTGRLHPEQIANLLLMTPHFFKATKAGKEAANRLQTLDATVDVDFRTLIKRASA